MPSLRRCKAKFKYKMIEKEKQIGEFLGMKVRHQFAFHQLLFCLIYGDTFKCIWESSKVKIFDDALWVLVLLHTPAFTKQRGANSKIWWAHEIQFWKVFQLQAASHHPGNTTQAVSLSEKGLCDVMSGDILELKAMMASTSSLPSPTPSIKTTQHDQEHTHERSSLLGTNGVRVDIQDETVQKNHISVANILSRPTPSPLRQTSASTFLCPENIPGK